MLTMKRMPEDEKRALLVSLGLEDTDTFVYEAKEGGAQIGYAVFQNKDGRPTAIRVDYGTDEGLFDGLLRAGMAWLEDNGFTSLYFSEQMDQALLKKWYFITDDIKYVDSIGDFLKSCKKCRM
ncbi:MAG: hypothetical protein IJD11_00880 [Oscillospiraceae bacterium]|nr:hypothetical protein [Oscillospiraceae bacterium]